MLGLGIGLGLGLGIGLGMGLRIGLGSGFDYFRQYNVIRRIGIRRNGVGPFQYGGRRHLGFFSDTSSEGKSCPGTLFSMSVSNLVQICS